MEAQGFSKKALGGSGEEAAAKYLIENGYSIIDRNWRCRLGEIDIIAKEKSDLVFVEVKTRRATTKDAFSPWESVNEYKQRRLRQLVSAYTCQNRSLIWNERIKKLRLDVIAVCYSYNFGRLQFKIEHLRQALVDR